MKMQKLIGIVIRLNIFRILEVLTFSYSSFIWKKYFSGFILESFELWTS